MPPLSRRPEKKSPKTIEYIHVFGGDVTKLSISEKYEYQDRSENFWRFSFETVAGEEGWFAWIRRPNSEDYLCVGKITERDLMDRLQSNPPPLTQDDFIDMELWMMHGGLDAYIPKKKRRRKKIDQ